MEVHFLSNTIPWFGHHTGYEQLPAAVDQIEEATGRVFAPTNRLLERVVGNLYSTYRRWPPRDQYDAFAEWYFSLSRLWRQPAASHILYLKRHLLFLDAWSQAPIDLIATLHQPRSQWDDDELRQLEHLSSAIVLYRRDVSFFEQYVGEGRVQFIPHGADVDFFRPGGEVSSSEPRLLFAGHHLRNMDMLHRVVTKLAERRPSLHFDFLVPERFRDGLGALQSHPRTQWHAGLSDEELRTLYQSSYLMLLPMNDSGANTAVVEALSCGLPIVTCDVGGIRDYGGGDLFPLVENNDDDAMIDLVEQYLDNPNWRDDVARACRQFAEDKLAWPVIARRHLKAYRELTKS